MTVRAVKAQDPLHVIYEKIGEATAVGRATSHAVNNISQKVDGLDGKVDALAQVVAAQGHLREDVATMKHEIADLKANEFRREGERKGIAVSGKLLWAALGFVPPAVLAAFKLFGG